MTETADAHGPRPTLREMLELAGASDQAKALFQPQLGAREYVELLVSRQLYPDAVGLLVQLVSRREGVWWAWSCACDAAGAAPAPGVAGVLDAVRQWILEPTDENRRAAFDAALAIDFEASAGFAGLAVFLCGETLGPAGGPPAPPGPHAAIRAIAAGICVAAFEHTEGTENRFPAFLARGLECAETGNAWERASAG